MITRPTVVTAAVAAAAALAATGITYASASAYEPAQAVPAVQQAAAPAAAPLGGDSGKGNEGKDNEDRDYEGKDYEGKDHGDRGFEGRIHINERSYSAHPGDCITVVSGLGSRSLNIRNDSKRTVEVFRGATCDNGAPIATVGPHSSSDGVHPRRVKDSVFVKNGVVGSFRVIGHHFGGHGGR
ncbi:hypothetical protein ACFYY3_15195 [Streptomyces sp. NPDC001812]|uniref:DUF5666 domain-containing protein n=1 Tax=Streptomyces cathayae TaxID=3031124 RepID=A0ABY8K1L4_9ACTN|nr:hypothetical protein [Streptomyces sp. HUAS 5]WGD41772.1 hypothetical protein PYS65_17280 [Streptomyces sp. HUAS 5]